MSQSSIVEFVNQFFRGQHSVVDLYQLVLETQDPLAILVVQRLSYFQHIQRRSLLEVSIDNFDVLLHDISQIRYYIGDVERTKSVIRERLADYIIDDTMFLQSDNNRFILDDIVHVMFERGVALRTLSNIDAYDPLYRFFAFTTLLGDHVYHDINVSRVDSAVRYLLGNINMVIPEGYFGFNPWNYNSGNESVAVMQAAEMSHVKDDNGYNESSESSESDSSLPLPVPGILESYDNVGYRVNVFRNDHRDREHIPYNVTPHFQVLQMQQPVQRQAQTQSNESNDDFFKVHNESDQESVGFCPCNWFSS